jgi:hypothetical protein
MTGLQFSGMSFFETSSNISLLWVFSFYFLFYSFNKNIYTTLLKKFKENLCSRKRKNANPKEAAEDKKKLC